MKPINVFLTIIIAGLTAPVLGADWPMWGGTPSRNMVSPEKNIPSDFEAGEYKEDSDLIDMATTKKVKWIAKMGSQTYGNPTIANGNVYVGTNNDGRKDPRFKGDYSILKCLDEKTGETKWILTVPKLDAGKVSDWEYLGIASSAAIDGDRVYLVTNRCEVLCLDAKGMSNGNQGAQDEGLYMAGIGQKDTPIEVDPKIDADILWRYDLRDELGVFPHNITSSSAIVIDGLVYVATSNGVDWSHTNIPSPKAPSLIALNKMTGELVGEEATGMSRRILHGGWSSPTYGKDSNGKPILLFGGPDGIAYAFDPIPKPDEDGFGIFPEKWRFDMNPLHYRYKDGDKSKPIKYVKPEGPSEMIASPVIVDGKFYGAIGQDPEHGEGIGNMVCLDLATGKPIWQFDKINRAISTCAVHEGLVYLGDFSGIVYCLDAATGSLLWKHDTLSHIWGSPLVVDGKLFIGNEDGDLLVFAAAREKKLINTINFGDPIYSSPVAANGVLYIGTTTQLYAIEDE